MDSDHSLPSLYELVPDAEQTDPAGRFMIRKYDEEYFEVAKQQDFGWKSEYIFKPLGHDLSEFEEQMRLEPDFD